MMCAHCGQSVDATAQFCSFCGRPLAMQAAPPSSMAGYMRPRQGRMIAGVCAGIARHNGWDVALVRLVAVLAVVFTGVPLLAYLIAWVVMPNEPYLLPAQVMPPVPPAAPPPMPPGAGPVA